MLYLIKQYGKDKQYLKIGYSKDIKERIKQYNTHCAELELIDTFEGTIKEENILQEILRKYNTHNEWMEYNEEIVQFWKCYKILFPILSDLYIKNINALKVELKTTSESFLKLQLIAKKTLEMNKKLIERLENES